MNSRLVFSVVEIKTLGVGIGRRISVRLNGEWDGGAQCGNGGVDQDVTPQSAYTIHAVLPYSPEFVTLQVGHLFRLEPVTETGFDRTPRQVGL